MLKPQDIVVLARLTQPYAVGRESQYPQLMTRLLETIESATSRQRFEAAGFGWRAPTP